CHALWQVLGHPETLLEDVPFPQPDPAALQREAVTLAVQVNGKLRGTIEVAVDATREAIEAQALAEPNVQAFLKGLSVRKVIVVPGKIVNVVAGLTRRPGALAGAGGLLQTSVMIRALTVVLLALV